jgi:hypothetical protein
LVSEKNQLKALIRDAAKDEPTMSEFVRRLQAKGVQVRADTYLSTQPTQAESEKGQLRDIRDGENGKSLKGRRGVGSSGRIRTKNDRPTPADSDPLDPDRKPN